MLGEIGEVLVEDVTPKSLTISWTMKSGSNWQKPSFLITWSEDSIRKKRSVDNQLVSSDSPVSLKDLKPSTKYSVALAPYAETGKVTGDSKEISATTSDGKIKVYLFIYCMKTLISLMN